MNPMRMRPRDAVRETTMSRRVFLKSTAAAGAGLTLALYFGEAAAQASGPGRTVGAAAGGSFAPNAFLRVGRDNTVTVVVKHLEMGQGTYTGLPTLIAEELDAAWSQVRAEGAPADASRYNNLFWGPAQGTGGSTAMANSFEQYRQAGAAARAMLVAAAAEQWKVPADSVQVKNGVVFHANGKKATFGELTDAAAKQPVPATVKLKDAKDFVFIGKHVPRTDSKAKSNGTAQFTQDVKLPDMLTAVVAHAPRFGQVLAGFDPASVSGIPGVRFVIEIPTGVAVIATSFWAAKKGRDALKAEWDAKSGYKGSSADLMAEYKRLAATPGKGARNDGDAVKAIDGAAKKLEAAFEFPFLAHAAMEPLNCVAKVTADSCEVWNGEQFQTGDQMAIAKYTGLKPEQVKLNMLFAGGSFGRRASPASDYVLEAVSIAAALARGGRPGIPVKLVWTREDDLRSGYYRPMGHSRIQAGLDERGAIRAWQHSIVCQSILAGTPFEAFLVKDGIDGTSVEGAEDLPYGIENVQVELHTTQLPVPTLWWRSVGHSHTAFVVESFLDEIAAATDQDPLALRRTLLAGKDRHLGVLELAAAKAGWGRALPAGHAHGLAVHFSFNSYVAMVVEASLIDGRPRVHEVTCAVDCGRTINPDTVQAQLEGAVGFALTTALHSAITLREGRVEQSNFHDYRLLRIHEMPKVAVHVVPSELPPTGVGEPGVPPIAPALCNALFKLTGKRIRSLPIRAEDLRR